MTKNSEDSNLPIPAEFIEQKIFFIRGHKVLIDGDLAALYEVPVKALNQAVKRNFARFPEDFMFQLTLDEATALLASRSQNVTLKRGGNVKYSPYAFTEQGVAMLATVLKSERAVQVSIAIVRVFVKLRQILATHQEFAHRLDEIERKFEKHDDELHYVFEAIRELMAPEPVPEKRRIGFAAGEESSSSSSSSH
jgi:hypothetical protein